MNSGGTTSPISRPRTTRRPIPTGRRPPTATTTRPSINCPGVNPNKRTAATPSSSQITRTTVDSIGVDQTPNSTPSNARP
ncbi:Uncharacterised protein [Mycobacterium tuberculosis]|nr:Uncharacterised protein [Mycobacterium tuberculosis]